MFKLIKGIFKKIKYLFYNLGYKIDKLKYNYEITIFLINHINDKIKKKKYKCNYYKWNNENQEEWLILSCASNMDILERKIYRNKVLKIKNSKIHSIEIKYRRKKEYIQYIDFTKPENNELMDKEDYILFKNYLNK